ncbi:MAG: nitrilotriacetate monooxygenase [Rhodospirillales bacterium 69-11]|nr:LLM class flavin-dependent oxidoreductase [Rhodospirillales bacterium]OJW26455.1 MAG: nitrilotriacetate monooxygenase [Rhodospirillales bacterium 69-11]
MKLGLNIVANGAHVAGWRMPDANAEAAMDIRLWKDIARAAERACVHFMFWADGIAVRHSAKDDDELSYNPRIDVFEPLTVIGALGAVTERLGFVASASTTYNEPYHVARKFASLDYVTGGRVAWNVVTSWSEQEAFNFGLDEHVEHGQRYRRAEEFVDVVFGLWDSWEDDAFIRDKTSGRYFDPAKLHTLNHRGELLRVKGPLNVGRPIQGYPVIAQAGSSGPGQDLGARIADLIYTQQKSLAEAAAFYRSVKEHGAKAGRDPDSMLVMPGILPVLGRTRAEAEDKFAQMQDMVHPRVGLPMLADVFGDLSDHDLDGPLPPPLPASNAVKSAYDKLVALSQEPGMTIRKLYQTQAGASGHYVFVGTAAEAADVMQDWFEGRGCDGWNLIPPYMPGPALDCLETLVPELQRRGLFQTEYAGDGTLRGSLGLARPSFHSRGAHARENGSFIGNPRS